MHVTLHHAEPIGGENRALLDARCGVYQYDDLVVLKDFRSPAVLFEAAVVVNSDEEFVAESKSRH